MPKETLLKEVFNCKVGSATKDKNGTPIAFELQDANPVLMAIFKDFCSGRNVGAGESLAFFTKLHDLNIKLQSNKPPSDKEVDRILKEIYLTYVPAGSAQQINLDEAKRKEVEAAFETGKPIEITVFSKAIKEMSILLAGDVGRRFMVSPQYTEYRENPELFAKYHPRYQALPKEAFEDIIVGQDKPGAFDLYKADPELRELFLKYCMSPMGVPENTEFLNKIIELNSKITNGEYEGKKKREDLQEELKAIYDKYIKQGYLGDPARKKIENALPPKGAGLTMAHFDMAIGVAHITFKQDIGIRFLKSREFQEYSVISSMTNIPEEEKPYLKLSNVDKRLVEYLDAPKHMKYMNKKDYGERGLGSNKPRNYRIINDLQIRLSEIDPALNFEEALQTRIHLLDTALKEHTDAHKNRYRVKPGKIWADIATMKKVAEKEMATLKEIQLKEINNTSFSSPVDYLQARMQFKNSKNLQSFIDDPKEPGRVFSKNSGGNVRTIKPEEMGANGKMFLNTEYIPKSPIAHPPLDLKQIKQLDKVIGDIENDLRNNEKWKSFWKLQSKQLTSKMKEEGKKPDEITHELVRIEAEVLGSYSFAVCSRLFVERQKSPELTALKKQLAALDQQAKDKNMDPDVLDKVKAQIEAVKDSISILNKEQTNELQILQNVCQARTKARTKSGTLDISEQQILDHVGNTLKAKGVQAKVSSQVKASERDLADVRAEAKAEVEKAKIRTSIGAAPRVPKSVKPLAAVANTQGVKLDAKQRTEATPTPAAAAPVAGAAQVTGPDATVDDKGTRTPKQRG